MIPERGPRTAKRELERELARELEGRLGARRGPHGGHNGLPILDLGTHDLSQAWDEARGQTGATAGHQIWILGPMI